MSDLESGNLQVMSSQAQGTLEGEGIEASRLLNGPVSEGLRSIGYGSIDSAVAGQSAMGAASANEQAARENAQNIYGAHNAQQQPQQTSTLPNPSEAVSTPHDPSPLPSREPLLQSQQHEHAGPSQESSVPSYFVERSMIVRVATSPPEELPIHEDTGKPGNMDGQARGVLPEMGKPRSNGNCTGIGETFSKCTFKIFYDSAFEMERTLPKGTASSVVYARG